MSAEPAMRGFDIGYVLFIDIVAYSRLSGEEQKRVVRQLNETVRATPEFQRADAAGQLLRLPAGDGMALVFSASPEAPVQCALEISRALKEQPHMQVRMGVNSGPIDQVEDVNDRSNVSGAGINMAQRVMSCGDAGHILLARRKMDATAPPTDHSLPHLSICALVALLFHFFSAHCLAADVAFSNDNQFIYAVGTTDNVTNRALAEIDLSTNTVRVIPLRGLADHEEVRGVASGEGGKILFVTDRNLWAFDPRSRQAEKLCSAPPGTGFAAVAYDPKSHAAYVTIQGENDKLFMVKTGCELVPVMMQPHAEIRDLAFSFEGKLFCEQNGDLWCGEIKSDGDNLRLEAERYAQGRQLLRPAGLEDMVDTSDSAALGRYIVNLAAARDGIYVQLWQYHNRGRGFGGLLKLPPPGSGRGELAVKEAGHDQQSLQRVKLVEETSYRILLGASPDGSHVYYNDGEREYLVTNGRTQKLQLRKSRQNPDTGASTSAGANSVEATPDPPSSATRPSDVVAAAVAEREIDAISSQNIDTLVSFYADKVDLLDKGMVSKETVRNNLQHYFDRWPITKWTLAGKVDVKPLSASRYQLAYPVTFEVSNPASNRRIVGTANETRIVTIDSAGAVKIVSQREKIIRSRTVGR